MECKIITKSESDLYFDLKKDFEKKNLSHELLMNAYLTFISRDFINLFRDKLKLDKHNLPTYESLKECIGLDISTIFCLMLDSLFNEKVDAGVIDDNGLLKKYDSLDLAVYIANQYNKSKTPYMAIAEDDGSTVTIKFVLRNSKNIDDEILQLYNVSLHKAILNKLEEVGITEESVNKYKTKEYFDVKNADNTGNSLFNDLNSLNSLNPFENVSDVFMYLLLDRFKNELFVKRLLSNMNDDKIIKHYLSQELIKSLDKDNLVKLTLIRFLLNKNLNQLNGKLSGYNILISAYPREPGFVTELKKYGANIDYYYSETKSTFASKNTHVETLSMRLLAKKILSELYENGFGNSGGISSSIKMVNDSNVVLLSGKMRPKGHTISLSDGRTLKYKTLSLDGFNGITLLAAISLKKDTYIYIEEGTKDFKEGLWYKVYVNGDNVSYKEVKDINEIRFNGNVCIDFGLENKKNEKAQKALSKVIQSNVEYNAKQDDISLILDKYDDSNKRLVSAFVSKIRQTFNGKLSANIIKDVMDNARNIAIQMSNRNNESLVDNALLEDFLFDNDDDGYNIGRKISSIEKLLKQSISILSKKINIDRHTNLYSKEEKNILYSTASGLLEKKKRCLYADGCLLFLKGCEKEIDYLQKLYKTAVENCKNNKSISVNYLAKIAKSITDCSNAYSDILNKMQDIRHIVSEDNAKIPDEIASSMESLAIDLRRKLGNLEQCGLQLKKTIVYKTVTNIMGESYTYKQNIRDKNKVVTAGMVMDHAMKDVSFLDRFVKSMSDCSDDMLKIYYASVGQVKDSINQIVVDYTNKIGKLNSILLDSGYNSSFMIERDSSGKKTGNFISIIKGEDGKLYNIDFILFEKDKAEYRKSLDKENLSFFEKMAKMKEWEKSNTKEISVVEGNIRKEELPCGKYLKPNKYHLSQQLLDFYFEMILLKAQLDNLINKKGTCVFRAVLIVDDFLENVHDDKDRGNTIKNSIQRFKEGFSIQDYDTQYGKNTVLIYGYFDEINEKFYKEYNSSENIYKEEIELRKNEIYIDKRSNKMYTFNGYNMNEYERYNGLTLDFSGSPISKVPTFFMSPLKNMDRLSTDVASAMMAYAGMSINYKVMSDHIDLFEVVTDFINNRDFYHLERGVPLKEIFRGVGETYATPYTSKGIEGNIGSTLKMFNDVNLYGIRYKSESYSKLIEQLKNISTKTGMGLNPFSGLANDIGGSILLFLQSTGGRYFNMKDLMKGRLLYDKMVLDYTLKDVGSNTTDTMLGLLIQKFDPMEDLYDRASGEKMYKNRLLKVLGNGIVMFYNTIGEHHLHCSSMLAMMNHVKFKSNGSTVSMNDIFEIDKNVHDISTLYIKDGVTDKDGKQLLTKSLQIELEKLKKIDTEDMSSLLYNRFSQLKEIEDRTNKMMLNFRNKIHRINQRMFGAYNIIDLGELNTYCLTRLVKLFRQWMPAMYEDRFGAAKYDPLLNETTEGTYRTMWRFFKNFFTDINNTKFRLVATWNSMSEEEKYNIKRASSEILLFLGLVLTAKHFGTPDDDDSRAEKMAKYLLLRMKLEIGAMVPSPTFLKNITTLVKSPVPAINNFNDALSLIEFWNITQEYESGRYKGYNKYLVDVWRFFGGPMRNVQRFIDLKDEDYMFLMFR